MKRLLILSGKGGTGKTTTAASFIKFAQARAFADCDVDAPNLHLVTEKAPEPETFDYYGSDKAFIDPEKCLGCGNCAAHCRFDAIEKSETGKFRINEYACEGCAACMLVCPADAVSMKKDIAGRQELYKDEKVFSTAELKMGRGNSGMLVSEVKKLMYKNAYPDTELAIIDGSPGIGCPVIASVSGVDAVLIITEPSASGLSDLTRLLKTASVFNVRTAVCVNKYDVCPQKAEEIRDFCNENKVAFAGFLPYDKKASQAINAGKSIADTDCPLRDALKKVFDKTMEILYNGNEA